MHGRRSNSPGARSTFQFFEGPSFNSRMAHLQCADRGATPRGSTFSSGTRKTAIRFVRGEETLGAAPRCPTISNSAKGVGSDTTSFER
jgi:hypothetical protein